MTDNERAFLDVVTKADGWGINCHPSDLEGGTEVVLRFYKREQAFDVLHRFVDLMKEQQNDISL